MQLEKELLSQIGISPELIGFLAQESGKKQPLNNPQKKQRTLPKVKASKRPKKRYLLFELESAQSLDSEFFKRSLVLALRNFFGQSSLDHAEHIPYLFWVARTIGN